MSAYVSAPCCEPCWIEQNCVVEDDFIVSVRQPTMLRDTQPEHCGWCGLLTVVGIYVRAARTDLAYPPPEES